MTASGVDGKEGVIGSSPMEGFIGSRAQAGTRAATAGGARASFVRRRQRDAARRARPRRRAARPHAVSASPFRRPDRLSRANTPSCLPATGRWQERLTTQVADGRRATCRQGRRRRANGRASTCLRGAHKAGARTTTSTLRDLLSTDARTRRVLSLGSGSLLPAAGEIRRRAWQERELPLEPDAWPALASHALSPGEHLAESELLSALRIAITDRLTGHQREVLVAITLNGIPIDVLAERLNTTRGALYETLHDARKKLRSELAADGFDIALGEREHHA